MSQETELFEELDQSILRDIVLPQYDNSEKSTLHTHQERTRKQLLQVAALYKLIVRLKRAMLHLDKVIVQPLLLATNLDNDLMNHKLSPEEATGKANELQEALQTLLKAVVRESSDCVTPAPPIYLQQLSYPFANPATSLLVNRRAEQALVTFVFFRLFPQLVLTKDLQEHPHTKSILRCNDQTVNKIIEHNGGDYSDSLEFLMESFRCWDSSLEQESLKHKRHLLNEILEHAAETKKER